MKALGQSWCINCTAMNLSCKSLKCEREIDTLVNVSLMHGQFEIWCSYSIRQFSYIFLWSMDCVFSGFWFESYFRLSSGRYAEIFPNISMCIIWAIRILPKRIRKPNLKSWPFLWLQLILWYDLCVCLSTYH